MKKPVIPSLLKSTISSFWIKFLLAGIYILICSVLKGQENIYSGDLIYVKNGSAFLDSLNAFSEDSDFENSELKFLNQVPNLGFQDSAAYFRFEIKNETASSFVYGYVNNPLISQFEIFEFNSRKKIGGNTNLVSSGAIQIHDYFKIYIPSGHKATIVVKVASSEQILLPIRLGTNTEIIAEQTERALYYSLFFGCMLAMLIYNLFIYITVRSKEYLLYSVYIFSMILIQYLLSGFGEEYLKSLDFRISRVLIVFTPALTGLTTIMFSRMFINTRKFTPVVDKLLMIYFGLYILAIIFSILGLTKYSFILIDFSAASALILVYSAIKAIKNGYRPAKFFLVAWIIFLSGSTLFALRNFGVIPFNNLSNYGLPIGSALETVLLSFALADRINQFKKEKEDSQQKMIEVMSENQRLIEEQNVQLELKVHERTIDLEAANDELNSTLQNLKLTQNQLVEAEKLASLGQMTAGIAHEINNPINFVQSNVQPLRRDIEDILNVLNDYEGIESEKDFKEKLPELKSKIKNLDIPYLKSEVTQLLSGIEEGARRTAEIVRGLRVFSRMDRDTLVSSNINDCINSTLVVMKSVTKGNVTISKKLDSSMPEIMCFPGKLNQVFMNLISNAVAATNIEGRGPEDRKITVNSLVSEKFVTVEIEDNGSGIPQEIRDKIFDPFFTTKAVGEGTGLGLSIVMGIVEEHNGNIQLLSEMNKGTKFVINLPRFIVS